MQFIKKDGITLAYEDINPGFPPMLLLHGWGCDHTSLAPQAKFFSKTHRIVSVDLRGHGGSDAPDQEYTMSVFADDLVWLCEKLELIKPIVIGHSMGGNVALEFAARYPEVPSSIVLISSYIFRPQEALNMTKTLSEGLKGSDHVTTYRNALATIFSPADEDIKEHFLASHPRAPQHVLISALANQSTQYDPTSAAMGCHVPVAYITDSTTAKASQSDLALFQKLTPQLMLGQTVGSGHFPQLIVPDQINAMLARFVALHSGLR
jgi:pimeloyl-ACP methyl ester carboxylesterase